MSLVRYNSDLKNWVPVAFTDVLDDFFLRTPAYARAAKIPAADVLEFENAYELHLALPGYSKENLTLEVEDRKLTVKGQHVAEEKEEKDGEKEAPKVRYHSKEIVYGAFERTFKLPANVDNNNIQAEYVSGILKIKLYKHLEEKSKNVIKIA